MSERFRVLCIIAPLVARSIDELLFTPTEDGDALQYEGPLSQTLLAVYPKVEGYEVTRLVIETPPVQTASYGPASELAAPIDSTHGGTHDGTRTGAEPLSATCAVETTAAAPAAIPASNEGRGGKVGKVAKTAGR